MIRIQLSYRIIKKQNTSDSEKTITLEEPKLILTEEKEEVEDLNKQASHEIEENMKIDIDKLKEDIRTTLYAELEEERKQILNDAKVEVDRIKLESRKQGYNAGHKEGQKVGYNVGYSEGLNKAKEEEAIIKGRALNLIKQSEEYVDKYLEENKEKIIKLAVDMAEVITHATIDAESDNILMLIKPILQMYDRKESVIITCNPANYKYVKGGLEELKYIAPETRFIILEDENIEKNGCIIENEHQVIDLEIRKQIEAILEEIKNLE